MGLTMIHVLSDRQAVVACDWARPRVLFTRNGATFVIPVTDRDAAGRMIGRLKERHGIDAKTI